MNRHSKLGTFVTALVLMSALLACKKLKGESSEESTGTSSGTTTASADSTGVAECDEYLTKYQACVDSKVPEVVRPGMTEAIKKMRETYKTTASNPVTKAGLAAGCKQALDTTKQAMSQYNCTW